MASESFSYESLPLPGISFSVASGVCDYLSLEEDGLSFPMGAPSVSAVVIPAVFVSIPLTVPPLSLVSSAHPSAPAWLMFVSKALLRLKGRII